MTVAISPLKGDYQEKGMICEFLPKCAFIERANRIEPFTVKMIKMSYCEKNKSECARYRLYNMEPEREVPDDLWPN